MGAHTEVITQPPTGQAPVNPSTVSKQPDGIHDKTSPIQVTKQISGTQPAKYHFDEVSEFSCLLSQPQHLVTPTHTEQFSRVYYHMGKYTIGPHGPRLGTSTIWEANYRPGVGLQLTFSTGHIMMIQEQYCQVTYVPQGFISNLE